MGLPNLSALPPLLRRQVAEIRTRAAEEERKLVEDAARAEARAEEKRLRGEDMAVEYYVRSGSPRDFAKVPEHRREEAERRRADVVERMRAADEAADERVPPGLRGAFPRRSRI